MRTCAPEHQIRTCAFEKRTFKIEHRFENFLARGGFKIESEAWAVANLVYP